MAAIDLSSDLSERQTLQTLEELIRQPIATVPSHELIEERPQPGSEAATRQRTYIKTVT